MQTLTQNTLFEQGYRIRAARNANGTFLVRKPDQTIYEVEPAMKCCNCMAGQRGISCKHLKQLRSLVLSQWSQVLTDLTVEQSRRYEDEMWRLICAFDAVKEFCS